MTKRAYTLKLAPSDGTDGRWKDYLWNTHEAINKGVKVFGDWLMTFRGGICHALAEADLPKKAAKDKTLEETRREHVSRRRRFLALSWLSVEDAAGAPEEYVVATGDEASETKEERHQKVLRAFRSILKKRGLDRDEIEEWVHDCKASITATIRDDAVWVNRSRAFDDAVKRIGDSLTRAEVWDILGVLLGKPDVFFQGSDKDSTEEAKDLVIPAGNWLSHRMGTGSGADYGRFAKVYRTVVAVCETLGGEEMTYDELRLAVVKALKKQKVDQVESFQDIDAVLSGPGRDSSTKMLLKKISEQPASSRLAAEMFERIRNSSKKDLKTAEGKLKNPKGPREWSNYILHQVSRCCGLSYVGEERRNYHVEYSVILDHAARRISQSHTSCKKAEAERERRRQDAERYDDIPKKARGVLEEYRKARGKESGALDEYLIGQRAIKGWKEIVKVWKKCKSTEERVAAVRELQDALDDFGDARLFEDLAGEEAACVREDEGILRDYVAATLAAHDQRRFKVPVYRHPDAFDHPVFVDFGKSRIGVNYGLHKRNGTTKAQEVELDLLVAKNEVERIALRWRSLRVKKDIATGTPRDDVEQTSVTRADRYGRAAEGVGSDDEVEIRGLFDKENWSARLQVHRDQLERLGGLVRRHGWTRETLRLRDKLGWFLTFSAELDPKKHAFEKGGPFALEKGTDKGRKHMAQLHLSQRESPGLRLVSVDLGHRVAAACSVWETVSGKEAERCLGRTPRVGEMGFQAEWRGKNRCFRRIARDGAAAPWAVLERQFSLKLPGEAEVRRATKAELERYGKIATQCELSEESRKVPKGITVDRLLFRALRDARLAVQRHGRIAKIAYAFHAKEKSHPGGRAVTLTNSERVDSIAEALLDWCSISTDGKYCASGPSELLKTLNLPEPVVAKFFKTEEERVRLSRKERAELRDALKELAGDIIEQDRTTEIHAAMAEYWDGRNGPIRKSVLAELRNWVFPRKPKRKEGESAAEYRERERAFYHSIHHVGGLSLTRIASMRLLYQIQKSFAQRPEPTDARAGIDKKGESRFPKFGRRHLKAMERLREDRVKQLASRIVEAALGIGKEERIGTRDRRRPTERVFEPCHAVVIENLKGYRPDELRTRRENRQLMQWSSSKIEKYLGDSCQLHGVFLRSISPNYTSRQDSRTGAPGLRCQDVPLSDFLGPFWKDKVRLAENRLKKAKEGEGRAADEYLVGLQNHFKTFEGKALSPNAPPIRLPVEGGEVFMTSDDDSPIRGGWNADLNAAANIGLRAITDPDWEGKWWWIPCMKSGAKPKKDAVDGSGCLDVKKSLRVELLEAVKGNVVNVWRDVSNEGVFESTWTVTRDYWRDVERRVVERLKAFNHERFMGAAEKVRERAGGSGKKKDELHKSADSLEALAPPVDVNLEEECGF